jgi:type III restriction enzyme
MYGKPKLQAQGRQELFPQVFDLVREYCHTKIDWKGCQQQELGLDRYVKLVVERFLEAIRPDEAQGEPPVIPLLHSYRPTGSTSLVDFLTTKPVHAVNYSHLNQVAADTGSWEQAATFALEQLAEAGTIRCFARNERLEFNIPYEFLGNDLSYFPDFLVQVREGHTLILEIKGQEDNQDLAKYDAAKRWVRAVNHWGKEGGWGFVVCRDPQILGDQIRALKIDSLTVSFSGSESK